MADSGGSRPSRSGEVNDCFPVAFRSLAGQGLDLLERRGWDDRASGVIEVWYRRRAPF